MPTPSRATVGNLPAELSTFVGRRRELGEVKRLLAESRLVTLTGAGGTGKTRLSLRVGAELRRAFADGVWFVDLTELHDAGLLVGNLPDPDALAFLVTAALGLRERSGGSSPLGMLVERLADRQMLLILDNCEHLISASASLANALLRGCPGLRVLATSREPLVITGETLFAVPPLPALDPSDRPSLADLHRCESVALFLARAEAVVLDFGLVEDNHLAVAELCHRLDGLPLAIELAAAWVRVLTPHQILDRLTDRFALLSRGNRSAPQRQQTLRACVDWSYDLCDKPERVLWARLSVFTGGFELDAAEGVCADEALPEADVLDLVARLVDQSILIRDDGRSGRSDTARYRMLEAIRDYGRQKLLEAGEDTLLRRRLRDWYERLVVRARAEGPHDQHGYWLARLVREQPNLRTAVEFCLTETGEAEAALRIAVTLPRYYWVAQGVFGEVRHWLDSALAQATAPTPLRARALMVNSQLAFWQGDTVGGMRLLDEGEELAHRLDASAALAYAAFLRGLGALFANDLLAAVEALDHAWKTLSQDPDRDLDLYLSVLLTFAQTAGLAGYHERAVACQEEMISIVEPGGGTVHRAAALTSGGVIAWLRGDLRQAAAQALKCLQVYQAWESCDRYGTALCVEALAWITADQRRYRRAATLLGGADALWTDVGTTVISYRHLGGFHDSCERQLRDALGEEAFTDAYELGLALTYEGILAYALDKQPRQRRSAPHEDNSTPLTRREKQIADLITKGLSNKDIAAELVISQRTAESHVDHILTKLGFTSRAQVAAWAAAVPGGP